MLEADNDLAVDASALFGRPGLESSVEGVRDTFDGEGGHGNLRAWFQYGTTMEYIIWWGCGQESVSKAVDPVRTFEEIHFVIIRSYLKATQ